MARIRSVHPGLWTDERFASVQPLARLLFIGIWNECDDAGSFEWSPLKLKMRILPADNADAGALLEELEAAGCIMRYRADGRELGAVRNFALYQRPKKPNSLYLQTPEVRKYCGHKDGEVPNQFPTDGEKAPQMEDGGGNRSSVSNETGAAQPVDPVKIMFDSGVDLITSAGKSQGAARAWLGKGRGHFAGQPHDAARVGEIEFGACWHGLAQGRAEGDGIAVDGRDFVKPIAPRRMVDAEPLATDQGLAQRHGADRHRRCPERGGPSGKNAAISAAVERVVIEGRVVAVWHLHLPSDRLVPGVADREDYGPGAAIHQRTDRAPGQDFLARVERRVLIFGDPAPAAIGRNDAFLAIQRNAPGNDIGSHGDVARREAELAGREGREHGRKRGEAARAKLRTGRATARSAKRSRSRQPIRTPTPSTAPAAAPESARLSLSAFL